MTHFLTTLCRGRLSCTAGKVKHVGILLLGLGANVAGRWGEPRASLAQARCELEAAGVCVIRSSRIYLTDPVGKVGQPRYHNAVLVVEAALAPGAMLRLLKRIERSAGRRLGPPNGPRPLDLDLLDYAGRRLGHPARRRGRGRLILPHPELHLRAFVLVPLLEVAPSWRHPVLGLSAKTLLARLGPAARAGVRQTLDFVVSACEKVGK